jgi:hypothetical protein
MYLWRARMADGSYAFSSNRRWSDLDRRKLEAIDFYVPDDIGPFLHVDVPVGKRLVRRERVRTDTGERLLIVALESEDRSEVEVWLARVNGVAFEKAHLYAYPDYPPELFSFEEVRS